MQKIKTWLIFFLGITSANLLAQNVDSASTSQIVIGMLEHKNKLRYYKRVEKIPLRYHYVSQEGKNIFISLLNEPYFLRFHWAAAYKEKILICYSSDGRLPVRTLHLLDIEKRQLSAFYFHAQPFKPKRKRLLLLLKKDTIRFECWLL